jgi:hypothetical protein
VNTNSSSTKKERDKVFYKITLDGKKFAFKGMPGVPPLFSTYELARQQIRKWIRKNVNPDQYVNDGKGYWDGWSRNPSKISSLGFKIQKVA